MGLHDKHRERVRAKLLSNGFDGLEPHQLLEFMLFSAIPRGDTNELAHKLINKFGSFNNVLEASAKELMLVDGIGPASALHISSFLPVIKKYLLGTLGKRITLKTPADVKSYFEAVSMGNKYETAYALFTDKSKNLITCVKLSEGSLDSTCFYTDKLVSEAIVNKAYYVAVAHNHPSGYTQPSPSDFDMAEKSAEALRCISKHLLDFVIVDHLNSFSFSEAGFLTGSKTRNPYRHEEEKIQAPYIIPDSKPERCLFLNDDA